MRTPRPSERVIKDAHLWLIAGTRHAWAVSWGKLTEPAGLWWIAKMVREVCIITEKSGGVGTDANGSNEVPVRCLDKSVNT